MMDLKIPKIRRCRICKSLRLKKVFSLGKQPLANSLLKNPYDKEKLYPLDLYQCRHCSLFQLGYIVPKEKMYEEYFYIPSVARTGIKHFEEISRKLKKSLNLKKGSLVVDIGGNDGSLLKCFKNKGMRVLNVDPAKNIKVARGIPTIRDYFTSKVARKIINRHSYARLVTATNSFAHIDDLKKYLKALDILLTQDGVFFAQFPDVRNLLRENQFDTIYHEHLSYFTYEPLHHLFANTPFELFKITSDNIHGGSMQIWIRRRPNLIEQFKENVFETSQALKEYIFTQRGKGKKIIGFGAAAKGTVLLNYCDMNAYWIDYVVDSTPYKQGKYIPGVKIPIYSENRLLKEPKGTIVLILAWNFKKEIINKLKNRGFTFIVPIPKLKIIQA